MVEPGVYQLDIVAPEVAKAMRRLRLNWRPAPDLLTELTWRSGDKAFSVRLADHAWLKPPSTASNWPVMKFDAVRK